MLSLGNVAPATEDRRAGAALAAISAPGAPHDQMAEAYAPLKPNPPNS